MKIIYAITKATWGGAQVYVHTLATHALQQGDEVALLAGEMGTLSDKLAVRKLSVSSLQRDLGFFADLRALSTMTRMLRTEHPDVLHLNSSKMGVLGGLAGRCARVPSIIFTAHGWPHREERALVWRVMAWLGSALTMLLAHRTITVSRIDHSTAPLSWRPCVYVPNGIEPFELLSRKEAFSHLRSLAPSLPRDTYVLFMHAELHRNKGIDRVIAALPAIQARLPQTVLVVCGQGEERDSLELQASALGVADSVFLLGFVAKAKHLLLAADVYLLPSRKEGLPMALLEAGYAGVPVVASAVGGIPEVLEGIGVLVDPDDTVSFATCVCEVVSNKAVSGARLRSRILSTYSASNMVEQTRALY
jgi:glycosyltransferase involved in cell wall biosynthesis